MIELIVDGAESFLYVLEIKNPAGLRVYFASNAQSDKVRVPVKASAFVSFRHHWKPVCGFKSKVCVQFHVVTCAAPLKSPRECTQLGRNR